MFNLKLNYWEHKSQMIWNGIKLHMNWSRRLIQLFNFLNHFNALLEDLKLVYITFIRSLLEQSCTVWNSVLRQENVADNEIIQKSAIKIVFDDKYKEYHQALSKIGLDTQADRRKIISQIFAKKSISNTKLKKHFMENNKSH